MNNADLPGRSRTAVLLDIDGTLLDSNDAHARSWVEVLARHGRAVAYEEVRSRIGKGGDKLLQELTGIDDESPEGRQLSQERKKLFLDRLLPGLPPTAGTRALLEALRRRGLRLLVATSAGGGELDALLCQAGVADLIEQATTSSDAAHSKPDPDIIAAALKQGGLRADEAVMIGDTPYDIEAAARAGVDAIALRCGGWWDDRALAGAAAIYDDPDDLLLHLDDAPIMSGAPR